MTKHRTRGKIIPYENLDIYFWTPHCHQRWFLDAKRSSGQHHVELELELVFNQFCIVILFSRRFYTNWMQEKWWWWLHKGNKMKATNGALVGGGAAWIKRDKGADQSFIHFAPITKKDAKYSLKSFHFAPITKKDAKKNSPDLPENITIDVVRG